MEGLAVRAEDYVTVAPDHRGANSHLYSKRKMPGHVDSSV